jgi:signal transduction histidine kinase
MGRLVGDLLLLARADAGESPALEREPVDLAELATEVVERARPQADERRLSLSIDGQCTVLGDRDRLKQLIANLVENAVRYSPKNGRIDIHLSGAPDGRQLQHAARAVRSRSARVAGSATDLALLTISDSGIGISPTDLPHVFERFFRADKARSRAHGGTGLGLSIAQYIAQAHGGSIQASSEGSNRGSTFTVRLPLHVEPRRAPRTMAPPAGNAPVSIGR